MATRSSARRIQLPVMPGPAEPPAPQSLRGATAQADPNAPRIGVVTLGCDKNTVDTERLLARLAHAGANVVSDVSTAEIVIVNTCGFIDVAKEESVDTILDAIRLKQDGRLRAVVAMGCLVQRYKTDLQQELPEVDLFLGLTEADRLVPELTSRGLLQSAPADAVPAMERPLRILSTSTRHTSYLKVSEGCDHTCAFCAIPLMRGRHRSTPIDILVREAQELERSGVVELNLISQDTTWYGRDTLRGYAETDGEWFVGRPFDGMAGSYATATAQRTHAGRANAGGARHGLLPELLRALLDGTAIPWFRLFYMYPSGIYREFVELMATEPRIVPYLDMPIQHGSDTVLRRMRRPERQATIRERVAWLRDAVPELALRTTVIVGFPGETDEEFDDMLGLLEELRFDHVGAFSYSVEEQTPAAGMDGHVPAALKRERLDRLLDLQRSIAHARNEQWLGREVTVLVDALTGRDSAAVAAPRGAVGRTVRHALEIDGVVHVDDARGVAPGQFVRVRVVEVVEDDMRAELIDAGD
jgi:ribosomal protein S12 methylthiotransferase